MAQSRKKRKQRQRAARGADADPVEESAEDVEVEPAEEDFMARAYARGRERDAAARAALEPLDEGERPTAVTVAAIICTLLVVAQAVAMIAAWNGDQDKVTGGIFGIVIVAVMSYGLWQAAYWAVLGLQTLLIITILGAAVALVYAGNAWASILSGLIMIGAGTLFWFLIKAMARIQMPKRPGE